MAVSVLCLSILGFRKVGMFRGFWSSGWIEEFDSVDRKILKVAGYILLAGFLSLAVYFAIQIQVICFTLIYRRALTLNSTANSQKAVQLLSLHASKDLLILPNVWNPLGARILQSSEYPAVATASAAISSSLGYVDGERIKRSTLIDMVGRIARSVDLPVTADIEAGYGKTIADLEETIQAVIDCGVVGVNIEDGIEEGGPLRPVDEQCERIAAVRQIAERNQIHLVINARIDTYISEAFASSEEATEETLARAAAYTDAGADCIYPIGVLDDSTIRTLRERITSPINILAIPGGASLSFLQEIGMNRVSFGPFILRSCLRKFISIVDVLKARGSYSCFDDRLSKDEAAEYLIDGKE